MYNSSIESEEITEKMEIGNVLDLLSDKQWHSIDDIADGIYVPRLNVIRIVNFFRDYGFVEMSTNGERVKIAEGYVDL